MPVNATGRKSLLRLVCNDMDGSCCGFFEMLGSDAGLD